MIKRLEIAVDTFWKCLKDVLKSKYDINLASPKAVLRASFEQKLITQEEYDHFFAMVEDRNDTSHNYGENAANRIALKAPIYKDQMQLVADRLRKL